MSMKGLVNRKKRGQKYLQYSVNQNPYQSETPLQGGRSQLLYQCREDDPVMEEKERKAKEGEGRKRRLNTR